MKSASDVFAQKKFNDNDNNIDFIFLEDIFNSEICYRYD